VTAGELRTRRIESGKEELAERAQPGAPRQPTSEAGQALCGSPARSPRTRTSRHRRASCLPRRPQIAARVPIDRLLRRGCHRPPLEARRCDQRIRRSTLPRRTRSRTR
jgi:hypothetical protein